MDRKVGRLVTKGHLDFEQWGKNWSLVDAPEELSLYWMMGISTSATRRYRRADWGNGLTLQILGNTVNFASRFKKR